MSMLNVNTISCCHGIHSLRQTQTHTQMQTLRVNKVLHDNKNALYRTGDLPGQRSHLTETAPAPCGQTDACENITLPQTSFAGGNKLKPEALDACYKLISDSFGKSRTNTITWQRFTDYKY